MNEYSTIEKLEVVEDTFTKSLIKYTFEELRGIRDKSTEPHKALLEQSSLPIKLIAKFNGT